MSGKKRRGRGEGSIEQLPSGSFRAVVSRTVDGHRRKASKTFTRKGDALAWKAKMLESGPAATGTFGDWLTSWLALHKAAVSATNYAVDRQTVEKHLRPGLGTVRLRDLNGLKAQRWLAKLKDDGVSESERHKAGRTLRKVLRAALDAEQIPSVPRFKVPKRPAAKTGSLTRDELRAAIDAADRLGCGVMLRLWADAGSRPGEVFGFDRQDFNPVTGEITHRQSVCKVSGKVKELKTERSRRTLPLADETATAVRDYLAARPGKPTDPLFPAAGGGRWKYSNFHHAFTRLRKACGVKLQPYALRHTMASLLLQAGISLRVVSERLGHEDVATTLKHYAHVLPGMQAAAAEKMGEILYGPQSHSGPTAHSSTPVQN